MLHSAKRSNFNDVFLGETWYITSYLVTMVPAESYFDPTYWSFSQSLLLPYDDGWQVLCVVLVARFENMTVLNHP